MNTKLTGFLAVSVAVVAVGLFLNQGEDNAILEPEATKIVQSDAKIELSQNSPSPTETISSEQKKDALDELSTSLQEKFGALLNNPKIQIRTLEKIIQELKLIYGVSWQDHIEDFIRASFPDLAEQLIARYHNLMAYNEWALDQRFEMANMSEAERRQYMWDKRAELFGEDAQIIWQGQLRSERVQDVLEELGSSDMALDQKIDLYAMQLNDIYQSDAANTIEQHRQEFVDHFLSVDTVQTDLHSMPEADRRQQLKKLRLAMGMDEAALSRWDKLDDERDQRWRVGKDYQAKRNELVAKYRGDELDRQVQQLQQSVFGEEAEIIRNEELSGYYRYEGEQQFGLN